MNEPVKKRPGRPRSATSHQAILQATLALLSEVGFDAMSMDAVAARAQVGKTTIYRRYRSKEELV
jgi:AcrR family transcriptional regulator